MNQYKLPESKRYEFRWTGDSWNFGMMTGMDIEPQTMTGWVIVRDRISGKSKPVCVTVDRSTGVVTLPAGYTEGLE